MERKPRSFIDIPARLRYRAEWARPEVWSGGAFLGSGEMGDPRTLIPILKRMEQILQRNDHPGQAEYVAAVATIAEWDPIAVIPTLTSGVMWGGSGAVWDVGRFEAAEDRREFFRSLVQLVEAMRAQGINSPGAIDRAAILSEWIEKGLC